MSATDHMSLEEYRAALAAAGSSSPSKRNKYSAKKTQVGEHTFDSKAEAKRYEQLRLDPDVQNLELQKRFEIVVAGEKICTYVADFVYFDKKRGVIVEDVKGMKTPVYRLKKKLFEALYDPLKITEIS